MPSNAFALVCYDIVKHCVRPKGEILSRIIAFWKNISCIQLSSGVKILIESGSDCSTMSQPSTPALQPNYMKVFIQRDYSDGTSVKFQTRFPPELEGRVSTQTISRKQFRPWKYINRNVNFLFWHGASAWTARSAAIRSDDLQAKRILRRSWERLLQHILVSRLNELSEKQMELVLMRFLYVYSEGCLACITAYLVYLCTETHYEKVSACDGVSQSECWFSFHFHLVRSAFEKCPNISHHRMNEFTTRKVCR